MRNPLKWTVGPFNVWTLGICLFIGAALSEWAISPLVFGNPELELIETAVEIIGRNQDGIFELRDKVQALEAQATAADSTTAELSARVDSLRSELYWSVKDWGGE